MYVKRELGVDLSSTIIYWYYKLKGLIRKPQKRLPCYRPVKSALVSKNPGEGVQMDVKYVYPKVKREYQFSVFDPYYKKYTSIFFQRKKVLIPLLVLKKGLEKEPLKKARLETNYSCKNSHLEAVRATGSSLVTDVRTEIAHLRCPT